MRPPNNKLLMPRWLMVLANLYHHKLAYFEPTWDATTLGMSEAMNIPYPALARATKELVDEGLIEKDTRLITGKAKHKGINGGRTARPYKITVLGINRFEEIRRQLNL